VTLKGRPRPERRKKIGNLLLRAGRGSTFRRIYRREGGKADFDAGCERRRKTAFFLEEKRKREKERACHVIDREGGDNFAKKKGERRSAVNQLREEGLGRNRPIPLVLEKKTK